MLLQEPLLAFIYQHLQGHFIISQSPCIHSHFLYFVLYYTAARTTISECKLEYVTSFPKSFQAFHCTQNKIPALTQDFRTPKNLVPAYLFGLLYTYLYSLVPSGIPLHSHYSLMFNSLAPLHTLCLTSPERYFLTPLAKYDPLLFILVTLSSFPSEFLLWHEDYLELKAVKKEVSALAI